MPIKLSEAPPQQTPQGVAPAQPDEPRFRPLVPGTKFGDPVTFTEQLGGALQIDNATFSLMTRLSEDDPEPDETFEPLQNMRPGEESVVELHEARSLKEMQQIRERLLRERDARRVMREGPLPELVASMAAIVLDPLSYVPLVGQAAKVAKAAPLAVRFAAGAATEVGIQEGILQATQERRPIEETIAAVVFGAGFGGALGAVSTVSARAQERAVKDFMGGMDEPTGPLVDAATLTPEAVSAAPARVIDPADTVLAGSGKVGETIAKMRGLAPVGLELSASQFAASRDIVTQLVDVGTITRGNQRGVATSGGIAPVEVRIDATVNPAIGKLARGLKRSYKQHKREARGTGATRLSRDEFYQEIGKAMRRGDRHTDPLIASASQQIRTTVVEPLKDAAIKLGVLPEDVDVTTALSYFTRVYQRDKIKALRPEFKSRVERHLRRIVKREEVADDAEYGEMADQVIDKILGHPGTRIPFIKVAAKRGPLKERTFNIPDAEIEEFLESNVFEVMPRYVRTMAADIEFTRAFGQADAGEELASQILREANQLAEAAPDAATRTKITKRAEREALLVQRLAEKVRGVTSAPIDETFMPLVRTVKTMRTLNFLRLLGGVTISSMPDPGIIVAKEGLARTMAPVFSGLASGFEAIRLGKVEAQEAGTAWEMALSLRARAVMDLGERYTQESKFERYIDTAGQHFGNITLMNQWNTAMKSWAATVVSTRILKTVEKMSKGQRVSARDQQRLARSRITPEMAERIARQSEHWVRHDGAVVAVTEDWTDQQAINAFRNALLSDVDNTILTPGAGDAPLWTTSEMGKSLFQFKRFASSATTRVLVSGLQARDMATLNGVLVMVGMGTMATMLKDIANRGEISERSTAEWINDGVDRSGVLAMFYEMDSLMEKASQGNVSLQGLLAGQEASRFRSRDVFGQLAGPTAGFFEDMESAIGGALSGEFTQSDLRKIRRTAPGQNIFYLSHLLNQVEKGIAKNFNIPETQPRSGSTVGTGALPEDQ